ncbi:DNA-binding protein [Ferruginibacter paludis]|uniref:PPC domain-containing DNA-binding protein n=1 Tax=Ferruginibacter paludis TaxID=1310417 RepID=UPI0025B4E56B|nr:PPC domain-containing DNA-binding protein [Ferruginibacter paludis]MDN3656237.1 DNA-binding protein [Ferruginibacter paludis]
MKDITAHVFGLKPREDLKKRIQPIANEEQIQAGWIGTCVGSLTQYHIRFANASAITSGNGYFEIVGLTGTVCCNGSHLQMAVSDENRTTIGGHLSDGCIIYTNAETVVLSSSAFVFTREKDHITPWAELHVNYIK